MIVSERDIYIKETETKPNGYAALVLCVSLGIVLICLLLNEHEIFHVGIMEMRIGSVLAAGAVAIPLVMIFANRELLHHPCTKYIMIAAAGLYTFSVGVLLTFHTTILLLFPIMLAMLYRSKKLGILATVLSYMCIVLSPVISYMLGSWDVPFFQELIMIGTHGGITSIEGGGDPVSWLDVGRIMLYRVVPQMLIVGACALLLFYNIRIGEEFVQNQILLNRISNVDMLTGLYNQNCYKEYLETEKKKAHDMNIGVMFFDVNNLKLLNDTKGHEYGDLLLQRCAKSLLNICDNDYSAAFRVGGDEFVVVVENATQEMMNHLASEWEQAMQNINTENKNMYEALECSMASGVALGKNKEIEELIHCADIKMYENKKLFKSGILK